MRYVGGEPQATLELGIPLEAATNKEEVEAYKVSSRITQTLTLNPKGIMYCRQPIIRYCHWVRRYCCGWRCQNQVLGGFLTLTQCMSHTC